MIFWSPLAAETPLLSGQAGRMQSRTTTFAKILTSWKDVGALMAKFKYSSLLREPYFHFEFLEGLLLLFAQGGKVKILAKRRAPLVGRLTSVETRRKPSGVPGAYGEHCSTIPTAHMIQKRWRNCIKRQWREFRGCSRRCVGNPESSPPGGTWAAAREG